MLAAGVVAACASFGSSATEPGSDAGADAANDTSDAAAALCMPAPKVPIDCKPGMTCDDFESDDLDGGTAPRPWQDKTVSPGATLGAECDMARGGRVLFATLPKTTPTTTASSILSMPSKPNGNKLQVALGVRMITPRSTFPGDGGYVMLAQVYCSNGMKRAFGILGDDRGLSVEFDNNDGELPGFARDDNWYDVEITVGATSSTVRINGVMKEAGVDSRTFDVTDDCQLDVGAISPGATPNLEVRIDDVRTY